jgi:hypothetical protein
MSSPLFITTISHVPVLAAAAIGIAIGLNALASVLRMWIEQASRTHRLVRALENSEPSQRPGIIMACSQLEGKSASQPGDDKTDETSSTKAHFVPPMPITLTRRLSERNRD